MVSITRVWVGEERQPTHQDKLARVKPIVKDLTSEDVLRASQRSEVVLDGASSLDQRPSTTRTLYSRGTDVLIAGCRSHGPRTLHVQHWELHQASHT
jgi:hypothetical protein